MTMSKPGDQTLNKFIELARYIARQADQPLTLATLAQRVHLSPSRFQRVFKSIFGVSPKKFQQAARSDRFKARLRAGADITEAIYEAGYGSSSRVYGQPMHGIGMTPKSYRAGGKAATGRGVCFAQFGSDCAALQAQLHAEYPHAELQAYHGESSAPLDRWIDALNAYIQNKQPRPDIPLDLQGTAFQIKVWEFLLSLRDGDVISYSELAEGIEKPRAVRAAASACGANRIAVLVPCHRILRGDGALGGYRWGLERKRSLLDAERARKARTRQQ